MPRKLLLLVFLMSISFFTQAEESPHRLTLGGFFRLGGFDLTKSAKEDLATGVSYPDRKLENALGKFLFVNYNYEEFGVGTRWMSYLLEGTNAELDQTLDLTYSFITASYIFLEGDFLHPDLVSRLGFSLGTGQNQYKLDTKSNQTLISQTVDESITSTGTAHLFELFFEAVTRTDWGYRMGYFYVDSMHS
ncbi:MAG: hypothetical protein H8E42_01030, partial [Nitrospinae bacterium]|nr:hypothetical protein [Nitrospinota bacterium]